MPKRLTALGFAFRRFAVPGRVGARVFGLNIGRRYSTPVRKRPLHPTRSQFKPEASQTQAPVTPATEPERRAGGSLTTLLGPHRHHPTARMPERRPAARLQGVPDLGPESTLTARAALASRAQGLYEPFHRALLGADAPFDLGHRGGRARRRRGAGPACEGNLMDADWPALPELLIGARVRCRSAW